MREFVVYTALRLGLLLACVALVLGLWGLLLGTEDVNLLVVLLIALVVSGVASYFLLHRQREAFARRVQTGAERASGRFDRMRAKEDD